MVQGTKEPRPKQGKDFSSSGSSAADSVGDCGKHLENDISSSSELPEEAGKQNQKQQLALHSLEER